MRVVSFDFYHDRFEEGFEPFHSFQMDSVPQIGSQIVYDEIIPIAKSKDLDMGTDTYEVVGVKHKFFQEGGKDIEFVSVAIDTCSYYKSKKKETWKLVKE